MQTRTAIFHCLY